jgi:hypothetical protein
MDRKLAFFKENGFWVEHGALSQFVASYHATTAPRLTHSLYTVIANIIFSA